VALWWWPLGMALAIAWFTIVYRSFRGRVVVEEEH
jgi:hypothetical protein